MAVPGSFVAGQVLTAAEMNGLPRGLVGLQTLTTSFTTSSTHTTYQDTGSTLTITEVNGRVYRHSCRFNAFPTGGVQAMDYALLRDGVTVAEFVIPSSALNTTDPMSFSVDYWYTSTASGSVTWKWQLKASASNTSVRDFGSSTLQRQYAIEDVSE